MKKIFLLSLTWLLSTSLLAQQKQFDIFTFTQPAGYNLKEQQQRIVYERTEGNTFCQIMLWPVQQGSADPQANFKTDWDHFAGNQYKIGDPKEKQTMKLGDWEVVTGVGVAEVSGIQFIVSVSTFTQNNLSWCIITQFNDEKYTTDADVFVASIVTDTKKFAGNKTTTPADNKPAGSTGNNGITKINTSFDDGWQATALADYVQLAKNKTEIRLCFVNKELDDAKSNMIDAPEYYWSHYIVPYYNVASPKKWSGVSYPIVYFMEGKAVEKATGRSCYVAIKIVYQGGANVIIAITPDENTLKQQFPHPNDMDRMLGYNKFAITENDVLGKWKAGTGGGIADYYNVYTGAYAHTVSLSTTDDFAFYPDKTYHSEHNSANSNAGGTTFAAIKYKGKFSTANWELNATNRVGGKTKKFLAQFVAIKGGFLLQLTDSDYTPLVYTLFRTN